MELTWENLIAFLKVVQENGDLYVSPDEESRDSVCVDGNLYRKELARFLSTATEKR